MKEKPIIFTAPMVRAILEGRKTQTRMIVKLPHTNPLGVWEVTEFGGPNGGVTSAGETVPLQPALWHTRTGDQIACKYEPGDRLWVKEGFRYDPADYCWEASVSVPIKPEILDYRADFPDEDICWQSGITMPRWASRINLEITGVRVERLGEISEDDSLAEGVGSVAEYIELWKTINKTWETEKWIWVLQFQRV